MKCKIKFGIFGACKITVLTLLILISIKSIQENPYHFFNAVLKLY